MGVSVLKYYQTHVKQNWKIAFFSAFFATLLIHIFKFTNTLPNHDSLFSFYSNLDTTMSGRWFLSVAGGFSSYFDLPWVNGLLSAVYLGITAALVAELFKIINPVAIFLSAVLLAASPCTTETFFYEFTADAFFLGLLLATAGSYLCIVCGNNYKKLAAGCICLCLSCGIYQAYISFAVMLFLGHLILQLLEGRMSSKEGWKQIGKQVLLYGSSLTLYYCIWKLILLITNQTASSYQGIDSVGQVRISTILSGAFSSVMNLLRWFFGGNLLKNPLTLYSVLHYVIVVAFLGILIAALIKSKIIHSCSKMILICVCLVGCIPVISMWNFVSDAVFYRPMMMHSVMVLLILAILLFDRWAKPKASTIFAAIMAVTIFNYGLLANIAYAEMDLTAKRSHATAVELMQTIHAYEYEDVQSIAFIGSRQDGLYVGQKYPGNMGYPLTNGLEEDLLYDHTHAYLYLVQYMGLDIPAATDTKIRELQNNPEVQALPAWPNRENAVVIDGVLVIKLANINF